MSWPLILTPLIVAILAYLGGYIAGKKAAELKKSNEEREQSNNTDAIISNNNYMSADDIDNWLRSRSKK